MECLAGSGLAMCSLKQELPRSTRRKTTPINPELAV